MVSEHLTGYMCGFSVYTGKSANELVSQNATLDPNCTIMCVFSVYTGKSANELVSQNATLDPDCTITTKTVMGLLNKTRLLDNHRTVFFDNYFR